MTPLNSAVAEATQLDESGMAKHLIEAAKDVFNTMVMMELEDSYPLEEPVTKFQCSVTGMVGLAGTYTGILSIHCPKTFAMRIASNMLGMEIDEICDDVNDALGEIANMLAGHVKQVLSKGGLDINLSIPTVISGEEYTINAITDLDAIVVPFTNSGERFLVGLTLRKEN